MTRVEAVVEDQASLNQAAQLLAIRQPEALFTSPETIAAEFRALARRWHPDAGTGSTTVFAHLSGLRDRAFLNWKEGFWDGGRTLWLREGSAGTRRLPILARHTFELGQEWLCPGCLVTRVGPEMADFLARGKGMVKALRYADADMRTAFEGLLPALRAVETRPDGAAFVIQGLAPDFIRLRDLLAHLGDAMDGRHAAWIISGLLNLACYLEHAELTHNDISLDTCFVSPERHLVAFPGAWWFGAVAGTPLLGLPARSLELARGTGEEADPGLDRELIRRVARALLGDPTGQRFPASVPGLLAQWSRLASRGSALEDYHEWMQDVLPGSYGARRFVALDVTPDQVYGGTA